AACNGATAGGGYELALACDEIVLIDDGSSTVALPEVPLLGVLPGTGGLTRVVDKRKIRRDLADAFSTLAEGVPGKRAVEWGLVDEAPPKPKYEETVKRRLDALVAKSTRKPFTPIALAPLDAAAKYVKMELDHPTRMATITVAAPDGDPPKGKVDCNAWCIRAFRELEACL